MLDSQAHVKLGSYEYLLAEDVEGHYVHRFEPNYIPRQEIVGQVGKYNVRPEKLYWTMDDWGGGEGNFVYYPDDPLVYNQSFGCNGRVRGQLTGRPARARTTVNTDDVRNRPSLCIAEGALWIAGSRDCIAYSLNGTSWTEKTQLQVGLNALSANYTITAVAGDTNALYFAAWHSGTSGTRTIRKISQSGSSSEVIAEVTSRRPIVGMCMLGGYLYTWTGGRLARVDIFAGTPASTSLSPDLAEPPTTSAFSSVWWADCIATETSVLSFMATHAQSFVYEYNPVAESFYQIWQAPYGFTIKSMTYQNGIVYWAGHFGGDSSADGFGGMYAMNMDTRKPVFIGYFRRNQGSNLQMQEMAPSYGAQVLVTAARTGRIFVYDTDMDSISLLDHLDTDSPSITNTDALTFSPNDNRIGGVATYGKKRVAVIYRPGAAAAATEEYQVVSYDDDELDQRQEGNATGAAVTKLDSGRWDFDFPHELKVLNGWHIAWKVEDTGTTSGLKTGQQIDVQYKADNGTWTTGATITSATSPSGGVKGRTFVALSTGSSTVKFNTLEIRIILTGTRTSAVNYQAPVLYALSTEASLAAYTETWELILRIKDEQSATRPDSRLWKASDIRDYLEDLAQNKNIITFLDGYRYREPGSYTTHAVTVEDPTDIIQRNSEGLMRIKLRATSE